MCGIGRQRKTYKRGGQATPCLQLCPPPLVVLAYLAIRYCMILVLKMGSVSYT